MQEHTDRRHYERIHLLAHARDKCCRLVFDQGSLKASLVDIGNGGARVRIEEPPPLTQGRALRFSLECAHAKGLLQEIEATVRWMSGQDMGIRFEIPLGLPLKTLQDMVS